MNIACIPAFNEERTIASVVVQAMRLVDRVRSEALGVEIVKILKKLRDALKSRFVSLMESYGLERARRLSEQALSWGYRKAARARN